MYLIFRSIIKQPKPVCELTNCFYIKPSYNVLAISKIIELHSTYEKCYYSAYKTTHNFFWCPKINSVYPGSTRPICEVQLLQGPIEIPGNTIFNF